MLIVNFTNGFGNNLFQYIAGRLLAENLNRELLIMPPYENYYGLDCFKELGLIKDGMIINDFKEKKVKIVDDKNYIGMYGYKTRCSLILKGYFEDYRYYINHLTKIKSWFPQLKEQSKLNLAFHLRLGDRLYYKESYDRNGIINPKPEKYLEAIRKFHFDKLYIITDMPSLKKMSISDFSKIEYHFNPLKENKNTQSLENAYHNYKILIEVFEKLDADIVHSSIIKDFLFMKSFKQILFQHSTTAWWAAILGNAKTVGVYRSWRPFKKEKNKNLSEVPIDGWFNWS